jgi:hypothetical protein
MLQKRRESTYNDKEGREKKKVTTHPEFRRRVDEFQLDFLQISSGRVHHERLAEGDDAFLGTRYRPLQHQEIVLDDAVVREASHRCDGFLSDVGFGRGIILVLTRANPVYLLVDFSTVVVAILQQKPLSERHGKEWKDVR